MEDQIVNNNRSELGNLSVRDLFYKYLRFLPLFLLALALSLLAAWVYLRYATRIYGASGTMIIKSDKGSQRNDKVEDLISGGSRVQNIQSEMEVIKSRPLMERVVNKLHLQFSYTAVGKIKEFNAYKQSPFLVKAFVIKDSLRTFSYRIKFIDEKKFKVNGDSPAIELGQTFEDANGIFQFNETNMQATPGSEFNLTWSPTTALARSYASMVTVMPKTSGTGILNVSMQTTNPWLGADIINQLMVQYDTMTVEQNNSSNDQILNFVDERLNILSKELDTIQINLLSYQQKHNLIDVDAISSDYLDKINSADKEVSIQKSQMDVASMIEDYLKDKKYKFSQAVVPSSLSIEDLTLNELVTTYNTAQLARQSLLDGNVPEANPLVKQAEGQIEKLRQSILENIKNIKASYAEKIATINRKTAVETSQFRDLPYKLKEYVELQRLVNTKEALYTLLQNKREEAAIARAATISNSSVIDNAIGSDVPIKPNKKGIQMIAIVIGIGLPALLIFLAEVINDKITTRFDIEKITKAPVLGEVGHSYSEKTLVVSKISRSMVAEQFRIIRSNLQYVLPKIDKPVILVTSSVSGEGKSFISTNMGAVMALTGKKTVILEFDIRKPKVLSGLQMSKKPGISNYLVGNLELKDLVIPVPDYENLFILPCGPIPPNPSELLLDAKVTDMFVWLKANFDVVIVDTAPVGMVSDAMTLGKFADCTLYLARQGYTFKKQITLIDEMYTEKKLPRTSIIINDVKVKPGYGYYGYGRYGYGYGYGQKKGNTYYEEDGPAPSWLDRTLDKLNPKKWFKG